MTPYRERSDCGTQTAGEGYLYLYLYLHLYGDLCLTDGTSHAYSAYRPDREAKGLGELNNNSIDGRIRTFIHTYLPFPPWLLEDLLRMLPYSAMCLHLWQKVPARKSPVSREVRELIEMGSSADPTPRNGAAPYVVYLPKVLTTLPRPCDRLKKLPLSPPPSAHRSHLHQPSSLFSLFLLRPVSPSILPLFL